MEHKDSSASAYIIEQIEMLDKEKKALSRRLSKAEQNNLNLATANETKELIYHNICHLLDTFDDMTYTEKNELIKKTVTSCILDESSIHIVF